MRILRIPVKKAVDTASEFRKRNNIQNPRLEARLLVASATERSVSAIISSPEYLVDVTENQKIIVDTSKNDKEDILTNRSFNEEFTYDVQSDKFGMAQYEENITNNLNSKISNDIIILLGTLK